MSPVPEDQGLQIDFVDQPRATQPSPTQGLQIDFVDQPPAQSQRTPFAPPPQPQQVAQGIGDAWTAGWQGSATGLLKRGRLPDIVLDAQHSKWYEKLVAGAAQMISEIPEMTVGSMAGGAMGGAAGSEVPVIGNIAGAVIGGGAGAFAAPTLIRTALMEAYTKGEVTSTGDFLSRVGIVLKATTKDAIVGALTGGAGAVVGKVAAPLVNEAVAAGRIGAATGRVVQGAATMTAEGTTMTVAPALLEGRLPEPEDFTNAAILMVGLKSAHFAAGKLRNVYAKTGVEPLQVAADAKTDPTILEDLAKPVEGGAAPEIPRAYQEAANQQAVADAVPGLAPTVAQELFGPAVRVPGEPTPTTINTRYLNTPDQVNGALAKISELNVTQIEAQRRGTVPWEQTQIEAGKVIQELTGSPDAFVPREPGTAAGAAELLARKQILESAANDMAAQARKIVDLGTDATPEHVAEFLASIDRAAMIQSEFLGARAEAGRALNILKETKVTAERAQQIQELMGRFKEDPAKLAEMLGKLDDPAQALKFAREASKATTWDKMIEAWKSALVSGPITQTANFMGNVSFTVLRPAVDAVAATIGLVTRAPDRVSFAEPFARIMGNIHGIADGLKLAREAFMEDTPGGGKAEHKHAIEGKLGYIVRTPFRALSAGDAVFRTMNERGEAYTLAAKQATKEGFNPATREFRERTVELANNPPEAMIEDIQAAGARFTFNTPLGEKGRAVQQFVKSWHLEWAVPFISTPGNVFKEMARLTPAAPMIGEWRADFAAGGPRAQKAMAEVALGTGLSALTMSMALAGHISGNGDPDPNKRRVQSAAGWQPYSVKVNGTWYSYQRFQPVGTLLGLAADMAEVWEHMTPEESDKVPKILATAFANSVTNQTFLQGMASVVDALSDPDRKGPRFIQNLAGSLVPAIAGQTAQMMDPYQREISSIREAIQNRIPGLRESLMPQRDPFGEPVPSADRLGGISPITVKGQSTDKVRTEAARLGIGEGKAPKSIQLPSAGLAKVGKVDLTPEQRDIFGDVAGHMAHQVMSNMVNSPGWDYMPDMVKEKAYTLVFEKSHQLGKAAALTSEQRQKEIQRIVGEVSKRLSKAPSVE